MSEQTIFDEMVQREFYYATVHSYLMRLLDALENPLDESIQNLAQQTADEVGLVQHPLAMLSLASGNVEYWAAFLFFIEKHLMGDSRLYARVKAASPFAGMTTLIASRRGDEVQLGGPDALSLLRGATDGGAGSYSTWHYLIVIEGLDAVTATKYPIG